MQGDLQRAIWIRRTSLEAHDTTELIDPHEARGDRSKARAALLVSLLAMVLALASLGGSNAAKDATQENILAANLYSFYQAKNIRQTQFRLAADKLEVDLLAEPKPSPQARELIEKRIAEYRQNVARYESEPESKEGKKELLARAKEREHARDHAMRQDPWFDYAEALLQIAIVVVSVSIIASSGMLLWAGALLGALGALATLNGFFLFV
jgi:hypothetical protein